MEDRANRGLKKPRVYSPENLSILRSMLILVFLKYSRKRRGDCEQSIVRWLKGTFLNTRLFVIVWFFIFSHTALSACRII